MAIPDTSWAFEAHDISLDELSDALDLAGITADGLSEDRGRTIAWFSGARPDAMPVDGAWSEVPRTDWSEAWKEGLDPVVVGGITVAPPWEAPDGPVLDGPPFTIVIEPGLAFGTGHHETTSMCLQALQETDLAGRRMVDIGTGTGVLAIAARALGAAAVVAVDIDDEAIVVARENIAAHGVDGIDLRVGSCDVVDGVGDVVLANIITDKLLALTEQLVALVAPGGRLICCGVDVARADEAAGRFADAGLEVTVTPGREWALLVGDVPR